MSSNEFNGTIPAQVFQLKNLQFLDLSYNSLKDGLSSEVGKLGNLKTLKLEENRLDGYVPEQIGNLTKLQHFSINYNKFSGRIPDSIGYLKGLERLYMSENSFSGFIPPSINIPEWIFCDCNLTGIFPIWLAEMEVKSVLLSRNKLTGSITSRLFQSASLSILALSKNNYSGELPENIGDANNIKVLMLSANSFSGVIPRSIADIPQLMLLDLSRNKLSGNTFPDFDPADCSLFYVDLSSNELSGDIPVSFCGGTSILALGGYKFSGMLPRNLTNMIMLEYLDLHDNNITDLSINNLVGIGNVPSELENLFGGWALYVSGPDIDNEMELSWTEGAIRSYMGMFTFTLEINDLTVNWKNAIQGLSSHNQQFYSLLDLSKNKLSGNIPASLGKLKYLKLLISTQKKKKMVIMLSLDTLLSLGPNGYHALFISNSRLACLMQ
ncbi:receptor-like protein 46 [Daucus carota subsp. sativus]|uniref:receptor-like protein 46 n=1 Tax=Daucus carota subsp. sativus TaxID=79200 RepID=UPI0007EF7DBF|nr:PREDICTED: probable LRR receptor-like serine/threonine-protein kinase At1g34110 [Daucus carota subsp. sativus]